MKQLLKIFYPDREDTMELRPDSERSFEDLVYDVKQKRKLNKKLLKANRRLKNLFIVGLSIVVISITSFLVSFNSSSIKRTYDFHFVDFKHRYISSYGLVLTTPTDFRDFSEIVEDNNIILESSMLSALVAMEKKKYDKAIAILDRMDSDQAKWLKALCLLRLKRKLQLKAELDEIISDNSLFTLQAKEIIKQYYQNDN
jgi:hypothetical protein